MKNNYTSEVTCKTVRLITMMYQISASRFLPVAKSQLMACKEIYGKMWQASRQTDHSNWRNAHNIHCRCDCGTRDSIMTSQIQC